MSSQDSSAGADTSSLSGPAMMDQTEAAFSQASASSTSASLSAMVTDEPDAGGVSERFDGRHPRKSSFAHTASPNEPDHRGRRAGDSRARGPKRASAGSSGGSGASGAMAIERIAFRLPKDVATSIRYWADHHGVSMNEYVVEALHASIRWESQDYPLPTLEQARLNQLIDEMHSMSTRMASVEHVIVSGFESLLNLTRGDNFLLDEEDGEL